MFTMSLMANRKRNPMLKEWRAAIEYHETQINRYEKTVSPHGQKWLDSMIKYHKQCINTLQLNKPPYLIEV